MSDQKSILKLYLLNMLCMIRCSKYFTFVLKILLNEEFICEASYFDWFIKQLQSVTIVSRLSLVGANFT